MKYGLEVKCYLSISPCLGYKEVERWRRKEQREGRLRGIGIDLLDQIVPKQNKTNEIEFKKL